jgi:predicted DNA-binding transcriptional regulator YafY
MASCAALDMRYRKLDETRAQRIVRPLRLEFWGLAWTLTAWRELRTDFRVERIENLKATDRGFHDERGKSYKDYLSRLDAAETPC